MGYLKDLEDQIDEERARAQQKKLEEAAKAAQKAAEKAAKKDHSNSLIS